MFSDPHRETQFVPGFKEADNTPVRYCWLFTTSARVWPSQLLFDARIGKPMRPMSLNVENHRNKSESFVVKAGNSRRKSQRSSSQPLESCVAPAAKLKCPLTIDSPC